MWTQYDNIGMKKTNKPEVNVHAAVFLCISMGHIPWAMYSSSVIGNII